MPQRAGSTACIQNQRTYSALTDKTGQNLTKLLPQRLSTIVTMSLVIIALQRQHIRLECQHTDSCTAHMLWLNNCAYRFIACVVAYAIPHTHTHALNMQQGGQGQYTRLLVFNILAAQEHRQHHVHQAAAWVRCMSSILQLPNVECAHVRL